MPAQFQSDQRQQFQSEELQHFQQPELAKKSEATLDTEMADQANTNKVDAIVINLDASEAAGAASGQQKLQTNIFSPMILPKPVDEEMKSQSQESAIIEASRKNSHSEHYRVSQSQSGAHSNVRSSRTSRANINEIAEED